MRVATGAHSRHSSCGWLNGRGRRRSPRRRPAADPAAVTPALQLQLAATPRRTFAALQLCLACAALFGLGLRLPLVASVDSTFTSEGAVRFTYVIQWPRQSAYCPATRQLFFAGASDNAIYKLSVNGTNYDNSTFAAAMVRLAGGVSGSVDGYGTAARLYPYGRPLLLNDLCTTLYFSQMSPVSGTDGVIRRIRLRDAYVDTPLLISGIDPNSICLAADQIAFYFYGAGAVYRTDVLTWSTPQFVAGVNGTNGFADGIGTVARFGSLGLWFLVEVEPGVLLGTDRTNGAIRRIEVATGTVTTIAGRPPPTATKSVLDGVGTSARLQGPGSAQYYQPGRTLYFVEMYGPQCLRKMNLVTGLVSTITCPEYTPTARTGYLAGLALDFPRSLAILSLFTQSPAPDMIWGIDVTFPAPGPSSRPASCAEGAACIVVADAASFSLQGGSVAVGTT